jgi:hypothetical protein
MPNNPWSDPKAPPPELNLPVSMGPINLPNLPQLSPVPEPKPKRRWGLFVVWTFFAFAGGIAAGPILTDQAYLLVERVAPMVGMSVPRFAQKGTPAPPPGKVISPAMAPVAARTVAEPKGPIVEARGDQAEAKPVPSAVEKKAEPAAAPSGAPEAVPVRHTTAGSHARTQEVAEAPAAHPRHAKGAAKAAPEAHPKRSSESDDPFASDDGSAKEPRGAAPGGKSKPSRSDTAGSARSASVPKAAASKSSDPLDNLMADGVTGGKGKKRESKDLDALLKDVQKSNPEPPPKREAPPPAASLSPADISRVMAGVKTRSNECAARLGQKGIAELKITVGKDGHVSNVRVGGKVAGTPLAACVEKATRTATFPASSGLRFDYRIDCR